MTAMFYNRFRYRPQSRRNQYFWTRRGGISIEKSSSNESAAGSCWSFLSSNKATGSS